MRGTRLPRTGSHQHSRRPSGLGQRAHLDTPMGFFLGSRIHSPAPHGGGPVPAGRLAVCHPGGGKRQKPVLSRPSTGRWIGILGQAVSGARLVGWACFAKACVRSFSPCFENWVAVFSWALQPVNEITIRCATLGRDASHLSVGTRCSIEE